MLYKLGKKPASPVLPHQKMFAKYRATSATPLPARPDRFGFTRLKSRPWGMLGNDSVGDCAIAGPMHILMLQAELVGRTINFTEASAIATYSEATGYDPNAPLDANGNNPTDQGTDMSAFMDFWKTKGIIDDAGNRHTIADYVRLDESNTQEVLEALWIFKATDLGIQFPQSAMDQTNNNELWDVVPGASVEGGHCIAGVSQYSNFNVVSWGAPQGCTPAFLQAYLDEGYVPITHEMLDASSGKDSNGFDFATLIADEAQLASVPTV